MKVMDWAIQRIEKLLEADRRVIIGIVAPPGGGKSTLAEAVHKHFPEQSALVPMDGFHLANSQLDRLGLRQKKGAPETFNAGGYVRLLQDLRIQPPGSTLYAPEFRRAMEEPIANALAVHSRTPIVITEGNYLLLDDRPWDKIRPLLDESWFLDLPDSERLSRLVARHMQYGRSEEEAKAWARSTDEPNAIRVAASRHYATFCLHDPEH